MNHVPTEIWNEIAQTQTLKTDAARLTFPMSPWEMETFVERWEAILDKEQTKVALALMLVTPLLMEREAIQSYLQQDPARSGLMQSLPEVLNPKDAAELARRELSMQPAPTLRVAQLLQNGQALTWWNEAAKSPSQASSSASEQPSLSQ